MDKNNPENNVSRSRVVAPIKINSIFIDFRCYSKQQDDDDGNNQNHVPSSNTWVELSKSADDSGNKMANNRNNPRDFRLREYVADKIRKQDAERGELLALEPNSNEAPANMDEPLTCANRLSKANPSSIHNTTVTTGLDKENHQMEKNTVEDPKGALSLSKGLGVHTREENPVAINVVNTYPAFYKNWAVRKNQRTRRKRRKLRLLSDIYQNTRPIGETNSAQGPVGHDLVPIASSGQSPSLQGQKRKELPDEEPPINMQTLQSRGGTEGTTTTFQVVNVIEDFQLEEEEEECSNILRIRRRKNAKKAI